MKKILVGLALAFTCILGCSDAEVASRNLSQDADQFKIVRRVVFYNAINGEYILCVEGRCSINIDKQDEQLELTVKTGENQYKKHYLGLCSVVTYFAEQMESSPVDVYHYKVIFKPAVIAPTINLVN